MEIRDQTKTVGIIPLYIMTIKFFKLRFRILKPIGSKDSDYLIPILSKEYSPNKLLKLAFSKINKDRSRWDYLDWGDIPDNSELSLFLNETQINNPLYERTKADLCPYLPIDGRDFEHIKQKLDGPLLAQVMKKERKLKNKGELIYSEVSSEKDLEPVMNRFFQIHRNRWGNTNTPSKFERLEEREHAMLAARYLFDSQLLNLTYIKFNNEMIAINFGMRDNCRSYYYIQAMDINYCKYSPGSLLTYYLIQEACEEGYKVLDFLRGNEAYKKNWGTSDAYNYNFTMFNRSLRSRIYRQIIYATQNNQFNIAINRISSIRKSIFG